MDLKAYAEKSGKVRKTLSNKVMAWRVLSVADVGHELVRDSWSQLAEIHAAPPGTIPGWEKEFLEKLAADISRNPADFSPPLYNIWTESDGNGNGVS